MLILDWIEGAKQKTADEWCAPCPFCGGEDRFIIWPNRENRYGDVVGKVKCRDGTGCEYGKEDGVQLLQDAHGLGFWEAVEALDARGLLDGWEGDDHASGSGDGARAASPPVRLNTPAPVKAPAARFAAEAPAFVARCEAALWADTPAGAHARRYLASARGLNEGTIRRARLGLHVTGDAGRLGPFALPRGYVIPWHVPEDAPGPVPRDAGAVWNVEVRRDPADVVSRAEAEARGLHPRRAAKYVDAKGSAAGTVLYGAHTIRSGVPVVMVEAAFDALLVAQEAPGVAVVATGSTGGARRLRWEMLLSIPPAVLVAFDAEEAGERAAGHWLDALPNAVRLRPEGGKDPGEMHGAGLNVRAWVREGVRLASAAGAAVTVPPAPGAEAPGPDAEAPAAPGAEAPHSADASGSAPPQEAPQGAEAVPSLGDEASPEDCPEAARLRRVRVPRIMGEAVTAAQLDAYAAAWAREGVTYDPGDVGRAAAAREAGVI